jgi:phosphoglycolate phosphatase-like HAD superfamily hydrolase
MRNRLILFDIDGTLVETDGAGRRAMVAAFGRVFGVPGADRRTSKVYFAGNTDPRILEDLADALSIPRAELARRGAEVEATYLEELRALMSADPVPGRVLPGVETLLERLKSENGVHLGLVTGNLEAGARIKLSPFGLNRFFPEGGFGSDGPDRGRLAALAAKRVAERVGQRFDASSVTLVGDTPSDISAARANGFRAVAVTTGWSSVERLETAEPDAVLDRLDDDVTTRAALGLA